MRGKRSKQYRKLMQQYALTFSFREPYQVLVDAQMIQDTHRFKMDLAPALSRTLHGEVKPMITQCSVRHLFALPTDSQTSTDAITKEEKTALLSMSRTLELRRCNHHTLAEPLSTLDCYRDVLDSKDQGTNKHRYILAAQDEEARSWARGIKGVPMIYVKRSVMVMEPMAHASVGVRERDEKGKLRGGVKKIGGGDVLGKRKRTTEEEGGEQAATQAGDDSNAAELPVQKKKKKVFGLKSPNPLSMKKKKVKANDEDESNRVTTKPQKTKTIRGSGEVQLESEDSKKKRRRKHKTGNTGEQTGDTLMGETNPVTLRAE